MNHGRGEEPRMTCGGGDGIAIRMERGHDARRGKDAIREGFLVRTRPPLPVWIEDRPEGLRDRSTVAS